MEVCFCFKNTSSYLINRVVVGDLIGNHGEFTHDNSLIDLFDHKASGTPDPTRFSPFKAKSKGCQSCNYFRWTNPGTNPEATGENSWFVLGVPTTTPQPAKRTIGSVPSLQLPSVKSSTKDGVPKSKNSSLLSGMFKCIGWYFEGCVGWVSIRDWSHMTECLRHPARALFKASHAQCLCFCPSGFWQKWHLVASSPSWCLRLSSVKKVSAETLAKDTCLLRVCGQTV